MATLAEGSMTLLDLANMVDAGGQVPTVAEILQLVNPIMEDIPWIEGNLETGHMDIIRTGYPGATWRKMYGFVQPDKGTTAKITDACGMLEAYSVVDKALADLGGRTNSVRAAMDRAQIQGMSNEFVKTLIYGNESTAPEAFTGLAPRYNSTSASNAENYLRSATSPDSSDNTSIWLIGWGQDTVRGIYPKGSKAGLSYEDQGEVTLQDSSGGYMQAYRGHYRWDCGLSVKDWRYIVRIMIDQEDLIKTAATGPDLIDLMQQATELLPNLNTVNPVFYCNRNIRSFLKRQMQNKTVQSTLTYDQIAGRRPELMLDGVLVKRCDSILNTETFVS